MFHIFERKIFKLTFQFVKTQFVCERSIKISGFFRNLLSGFRFSGIFDFSHDIHSVGNHDKYHPHIFSKRKQ